MLTVEQSSHQIPRVRRQELQHSAAPQRSGLMAPGSGHPHVCTEDVFRTPWHRELVPSQQIYWMCQGGNQGKSFITGQKR